MTNAVEMNHTCWHLVNRGKELLIGTQQHTPKRVAWDGWVVVKEPVQQVDWGPHGLSKDDLG
jgi:hypothetical protein